MAFKIRKMLELQTFKQIVNMVSGYSKLKNKNKK